MWSCWTFLANGIGIGRGYDYRCGLLIFLVLVELVVTIPCYGRALTGYLWDDYGIEDPSISLLSLMSDDLVTYVELEPKGNWEAITWIIWKLLAVMQRFGDFGETSRNGIESYQQSHYQVSTFTKILVRWSI